MEVTIKIDTGTKEGRSLLEFLKSLSFVEVVSTDYERLKRNFWNF